MCSPIRSLIESGFDAAKRSDVRLYYGARNLQRMAYQVSSVVLFVSLMIGKLELLSIRACINNNVLLCYRIGLKTGNLPV